MACGRRLHGRHCLAKLTFISALRLSLDLEGCVAALTIGPGRVLDQVGLQVLGLILDPKGATCLLTQIWVGVVELRQRVQILLTQFIFRAIRLVDRRLRPFNILRLAAPLLHRLLVRLQLVHVTCDEWVARRN